MRFNKARGKTEGKKNMVDLAVIIIFRTCSIEMCETTNDEGRKANFTADEQKIWQPQQSMVQLAFFFLVHKHIHIDTAAF